MTDEASQTAPGRGTPRSQDGAARRRESTRRPASHPLLGAFPLSVMTLAAFLVVFAVMMARLTAGKDPALRRATPSALVGATSGAGPLRTRASGAASVVPASAEEGAGQATPAIVTRTSGLGTAGGGRED